MGFLFAALSTHRRPMQQSDSEISASSGVSREIERLLPELYSELTKIDDAIGDEKFDNVVETAYRIIRGISIDYGVMEANTTYGVIGVKVWLFKGEILEKGVYSQVQTEKVATPGAMES